MSYHEPASLKGGPVPLDTGVVLNADVSIMWQGSFLFGA